MRTAWARTRRPSSSATASPAFSQPARQSTPPGAMCPSNPAAVSALAALAGAFCVRAHDVSASLGAVRMAAYAAPRL